MHFSMGGTVLYDSPEKIFDPKDYKANGSEDIYAAANSLYQLMTKKEPYHACALDVKVFIRLKLRRVFIWGIRFT